MWQKFILLEVPHSLRETSHLMHGRKGQGMRAKPSHPVFTKQHTLFRGPRFCLFVSLCIKEIPTPHVLLWKGMTFPNSMLHVNECLRLVKRGLQLLEIFITFLSCGSDDEINLDSKKGNFNQSGCIGKTEWDPASQSYLWSADRNFSFKRLMQWVRGLHN